MAVAFDLGVLHYRMNNYDNARLYFDEVLRVNPNHLQCLEYRARLLRDSGHDAAAVNDFKRVFALQEKPDPGHYISVAEILRSTGTEGVDQALAILDAGTVKLGLTPQLQRYAIELELARGKPGAAVQRLWTLQPMLGASPEWKVDMGELMFKMSEPQQAVMWIQAASMQLKALRITPARLELKERIDRLNTIVG